MKRKQLSSFRESGTSKYGLAVLRRLGTPVSLGIVNDVRSGNFQAVADSEIDPNDYVCPEAFRKDWLAVNLLRKSIELPLAVDREKVALEAFFVAEEHCRAINHYGRNPFVPDTGSLSQSFEATLWLAKEKIRDLLGRFDWNKAHEFFGFSGGASTRLPRKSGSPFYKYDGKPHTTRNNAYLAIAAIWSIPAWRARMQDRYGLDPCNWVEVVDGSKVTTVPKSAKTDRTICIEPDMNMYVQRGIGGLIRKALKRVGINLNDQTRNQRLALTGSLLGSLATIDLKSASDSVSLALVSWLMPHDWFAAIMRTRSEVCTLPDGTKHRLEKVSSMGNGFTFELESLIFWALSSAVVDLSGIKDRRIGIYGDDIIVHHEVAPRLIEVLEYCGFQTNDSKTFLSGPFRESCGKHYFYGADVTPIYIKEGIEKLERKYWLINSLNHWCSFSFSDEVKYIVKSIRKDRLYYTPPGYSYESGIIVDSPHLAKARWHRRKMRWQFTYWAPTRRRHKPSGVPAVLAWFAMTDRAPSDQEWFVEKGDSVYRRKVGRTSSWCDLGVNPYN